MIFDRDSWQEIFATIKKNRLRTFLTAFGVFWGIFMLVIMLGSGSGLRNGVMAEFASKSTNSFYIWAQQTSKAYKGMKPGRSFNFNNDDIEALKKIPELKYVSPNNQLGDYGGSNNVVRGIKTGGFAVMGQTPDVMEIEARYIKSGRFINKNDLIEKRKVCVIGVRVYEMLFAKNENAIAQYIKINGINFKVIGVTEPMSSGDQGEEQSEQVIIPFTTFQNAFNYGNKVGSFAIMVKEGVPASFAEKKAKDLIKERHKIAPEDLTAVGSWNAEEEFSKLTELFSGIEILVWIVGIGTLFAGVIGVSNIMLIVVKERTREIGVKRALGATPFNITSQIVMESLFLTAFSGYFGMTLGIWLIELIASSLPKGGGGMFQNPEVELPVVIKALTILVVSGAIAGLIPANRAVSISPVEALRNE